MREKISQSQREQRINQKGTIFWFTGVSGSGKTTLTTELEKQLFDRNSLAYLLDGDSIRGGLNSDLTFSPEDRCENIRRVGEVARLFADAGFFVIVAFISPFRKDRDRVRNLMSPGRFIEVFVDCPLSVCEKRDPKGMYKKARAGIIPEFTGISSPYEPPKSPEIHLHTDQHTIEVCVKQVMDFFQEIKLFDKKTMVLPHS
jgi:adenylylsulfate kinase